MTETLTPPQPDGPPVGIPRRLVRTDEGKIIAGVSSGLGRYTDVDPVLFRVTFGVLTVLGGSGLVVYALAWLLLPKEGAGPSLGERALHRIRHSWLTRRTTGRVLLFVLGALALLAVGAGSDASSFVVLAVVATGVWLAVRGRAPVPVGDPIAAPPAAWPVDPATPAEPPPPKSRLGRLTLSVLLLVLGIAALLDTAGWVDVSGSAVLALSLTVVGAGLVAGTWYGRSWGLLVLGALLALLLLAASTATDVRGGAGTRTWAPTTQAELPASYRLSLGEGRLDLTGLPVAGRTVVQARIGVGSLVVTVPRDIRVEVRAHATAGSTEVFGEFREGFDVTTDVDGPAEPASAGGGSDARVLVLDLRVGLGELVVDRA